MLKNQKSKANTSQKALGTDIVDSNHSRLVLCIFLRLLSSDVINSVANHNYRSSYVMIRQCLHFNKTRSSPQWKCGSASVELRY